METPEPSHYEGPTEPNLQVSAERLDDLISTCSAQP